MDNLLNLLFEYAGHIIVLVGIVNLAGGIINYDSFYRRRRPAMVVAAISRTGARIFYTILGLIFCITGVAEILGMIDLLGVSS